jgi:hypothetical protein
MVQAVAVERALLESTVFKTLQMAATAATAYKSLLWQHPQTQAPIAAITLVAVAVRPTRAVELQALVGLVVVALGLLQLQLRLPLAQQILAAAVAAAVLPMLLLSVAQAVLVS